MHGETLKYAIYLHLLLVHSFSTLKCVNERNDKVKGKAYPTTSREGPVVG